MPVLYFISGVSMSKDFITVRQAASQLGVSVQSVYELINAGKLTAMPSPAGKLVLQSEVDAWADRRYLRQSILSVQVG
jgi:excisionase family DNA binding protein